MLIKMRHIFTLFRVLKLQQRCLQAKVIADMIYIDYCCWIASSAFCNKRNPNPNKTGNAKKLNRSREKGDNFTYLRIIFN